MKLWDKIILGFMLALAIAFVALFIVRADDPPKPKEEPKDTTRVNIQQMQEINRSMKMDLNRLDSFLIRIDSLKKK